MMLFLLVNSPTAHEVQWQNLILLRVSAWPQKSSLDRIKLSENVLK